MNGHFFLLENFGNLISIQHQIAMVFTIFFNFNLFFFLLKKKKKREKYEIGFWCGKNHLLMEMESLADGWGTHTKRWIPNIQRHHSTIVVVFIWLKWEDKNTIGKSKCYEFRYRSEVGNFGYWIYLKQIFKFGNEIEMSFFQWNFSSFSKYIFNFWGKITFVFYFCCVHWKCIPKHEMKIQNDVQELNLRFFFLIYLNCNSKIFKLLGNRN